MENNNRVFIDAIDGFGFEELCAEIYRRSGYSVQNIQYTGDEGRDLIIRTPDGETIVAECKHWPGRPVGRPVVQKLHSAVMTFPATRGVVLTTGYFPKTAREYVGKINESIELVDLPMLRDLAARAGITLLSKEDQVPVLTFSTSDSSDLKGQLSAQVFSVFDSAPSTPDILSSVEQRTIEMRPAYHIRYSLAQDFSTSVGLIHRINIPNGSLFIDAEDGTFRDENLVKFLQEATTIPLGEDRSACQSEIHHTFKLDVAAVREVAAGYLINRHRTNVSYWGRNNQGYTLDCKPSKKNIFYRDIQQVYIPEQRLGIRILSNQYDFEFVENGRRFYWLRSPAVYHCQLCPKTVSQGLLCNSCGAVTCSATFFWPHSFHCRRCRKTICQSCAFWVKRWSIFKSVICEDCSNGYPEMEVQKLKDLGTSLEQLLSRSKVIQYFRQSEDRIKRVFGPGRHRY